MLNLTPDLGAIVMVTLVIILLSFVVYLISKKVVFLAVTKFDDGDDSVDTILEQRAKTIGSLINNTLGVVIWGVALMMILSEWGINIAPVLAGAGVIGLAVGFGAQTLVKDVVTGFFILLENQFNVSDKVVIAGLEGKVIAMNLRTTILQDKDGITHIIPNNKITTVSKLKRTTRK